MVRQVVLGGMAWQEAFEMLHLRPSVICQKYLEQQGVMEGGKFRDARVEEFRRCMVRMPLKYHAVFFTALANRLGVTCRVVTPSKHNVELEFAFAHECNTTRVAVQWLLQLELQVACKATWYGFGAKTPGDLVWAKTLLQWAEVVRTIHKMPTRSSKLGRWMWRQRWEKMPAHRRQVLEQLGREMVYQAPGMG